MFEVIKYIGTPLALIAFIYAGYINLQNKKIKKYDNLLNSKKTKEQIETIQKIINSFTNEPLTVNDIKNDSRKMELAKENIKMKTKSNSQKFILSIILACLFSIITVIGILVSAYEISIQENIQTTPEVIEKEFIEKIKEVDIGISDNFVKETLDMPPVVDKIVAIGLNDDNNEVINEEFRQQLYVAENCFLYTLSRNNSIEVYSVTITKEDAYFDMPEGISSMMANPESKLGKLTLADISDIEPEAENILMNQSSKFSEYFEKQYFGFPGHYYDYIFGYTDLGYQFNDLEDENVFYHYEDYSSESVETRYNLRKEFKPNLFAVSGINLSYISDVSIFFYEGINFVWD